MKLFQSARARLTILLMLILVVSLAACGGTGGEADTEAPLLTLAKVPVSTIERSRVLSGTVEPGAQLEISRNSVVVTSPVPDAIGNWSSSIDLLPGVNTITVKATDATGNNHTLSFVLTYEVVTLDQVLLKTSVQGQTLSGTLANGASLSGSVKDAAGVEVQTISGISTKNWTQALIGLADGTYSLTLTGTDNTAQKTTLTETLIIDATLPSLNVTPIASQVTSDSISIEGTAAENSTISLVVPAGVFESDLPVIRPPGVWSRTLTGLPAGRRQIDVTATAVDGKQSTARLFVLYQP